MECGIRAHMGDGFSAPLVAQVTAETSGKGPRT
jgi:hypothetical protein